MVMWHIRSIIIGGHAVDCRGPWDYVWNIHGITQHWKEHCVHRKTLYYGFVWTIIVNIPKYMEVSSNYIFRI